MMKTRPIAEKDMMTILIEKIRGSEIVFHPDTDNTFAAYQIILQQPGRPVNIWVNARNMDIFADIYEIERAILGEEKFQELLDRYHQG